MSSLCCTRSRLLSTALRSPIAQLKIQRNCISNSAAPRSNWLALLGIAVLSGGLGYSAATFYPSRLALILNSPDSPPPFSIESPAGQKQMELLEQQMQNLDIVKRLRAEQEPTQSASTTSLQSNSPSPLQQQRKWLESRPYLNYPEEKRVHHLTAGALRGPGKLGVRPLVFSTSDNMESYIILHVGRSLCGHHGVIHGVMINLLEYQEKLNAH